MNSIKSHEMALRNGAGDVNAACQHEDTATRIDQRHLRSGIGSVHEIHEMGPSDPIGMDTAWYVMKAETQLTGMGNRR